MKKMFEVLNSYDKAAKLANFRARIVRDPTTEWPSDSSEFGDVKSWASKFQTMMVNC